MTTVYSAQDVAKHNTKKDLWISIHGKVYDVSSYAEDHPGGVDSLMEAAGKDGTVQFEDLGHTADAREMMEKFLIGKLDHVEEDLPQKIERHIPATTTAPPKPSLNKTIIHGMADVLSMSLIIVADFTFVRRFSRFSIAHHWPVPLTIANLLPWATSISLASYLTSRLLKRIFPPAAPTKRPTHFKVSDLVAHPKQEDYAILDPRRFTELPVTAVENLSANTNKIVLSLPTANSILGLPVGQHIAIRGVIDDKPVNRSYTPTSSNKDRGRLELVIKNYDDGLLTGKYLKNVAVGDKLSISGPRGQMRYRRGLAKNIGMLAGGTGITPMFQLIRAICEDPRDQTKVVLLYANQTEKDILLKKELDEFATKHSDQFQVKHLLSKPDGGWKGGVGRITQDLVASSFEGDVEDRQGSKVMLCGPPGMVEAAKGWLNELGYEKPNAVSKMQDQVFVF